MTKEKGVREDIFMAYDIRGKGITTHEAFLIGRAMGTLLDGSCFVAQDCRKDSPALSEHLIQGLRSSGIKVTRGGLMTGPAAYYKTMNNYDFGVFVTASHNPAEYNGFKMMLRDGSSLDPADLKKIKFIAMNYKFSKENSRSVNQDITAMNDYCRFLEKIFKKTNIKGVIDCFNATSGILTNKIYKRLLNAIVLNNEPLSDFGGKHPEPTPKNLVQVQEEVLKNKADFGVGLDGDGDRSVFVDDKGRVIDGNKMTMFFAKQVLTKNKGGTIVSPVSVSKLLETKIVKPLGGKMIWCPVGHTFIEKELVKHNGIFGGEFSSHFFWNEFFPYSDGTFSLLMLAKILSESKKSFSELIDELPKVFVVKEEVEFNTHKEKIAVANLLVRNFLLKNPNALTLDGIKFVDGKANVLLRQSLTRHTVKAFVESEDKELAEKKLEDYIKLIQSYKEAPMGPPQGPQGPKPSI